jgi:hypothetical protein
MKNTKLVLMVLAFLVAGTAQAATVYGVGATKIAADGLSEQGEQTGHLKMLYDTYELAADTTSGDVIRMGGKIPKGARIVDVKLIHDDLGTGSPTVDVGWLASADAVEGASAIGFMDEADVGDVDIDSMLIDEATNAVGAMTTGIGKKFSAAVQPVIKTSVDLDATSGTISLMILYVTE